MMHKIFASFIFLLMLSPQAWAQPDLTVDLSPQWQAYDHNNAQYKPFVRGQDAEVLYFLLDANQYGNQHLIIESLRDCNVFVNTQLYYTGRILKVKIDSLAAAFQSPLLTIAVVQPQAGFGLQTFIQQPKDKLETESSSSLHTALRNFAVIGALVLIVMLVILIQLNPKLASDYFSVSRIFSNRESNDVQVQSRISNSTNILFYIFCSLLIGFCLLLVFNFVSGHYSIALAFIATNFSAILLNWLKISALVLAFFFAKILLIYGLSTVFNVQGVTGMYFFNWIRVLLLTSGAVAVVLFVYFIRYGNDQNFFRLLFEILPWMLTGWIVLIAFKLRQKLNASLFHLFSYICATELIPFLITIKVLFS